MRYFSAAFKNSSKTHFCCVYSASSAANVGSRPISPIPAMRSTFSSIMRKRLSAPLDLADKQMILAFVGVHPEKASGGADNLLRIIDENVERIAGIGEIGLDPTLAADEAEYTQQKCVFDEFLNAAEKYRMPVSIHSRKSIDDVLDALSTHSVRSACLHWYDGNKKQLRRAVDAGLYLGFGPVMVYANDKKSLLAKTPQDRILVETDGPVRFSRCFGMRSAQITFIPSIIYAASQALGLAYEETEHILRENSGCFLQTAV